MSVVALDIGGTNVRAARVDADGSIFARRVTPTSRDAAGTLQAVASAVADPSVTAIGLGVTGPVDVRSGIVDNPHTLPGWEGLDLRAALRSFGVPVVVDNDANAAALGEWWLGERAQRLAMVTLGTGIGVGLVVGGAVVRGPGGVHGEAGHQVLDPNGPECYCGARGCWEQLAAGPALPRLASAAGLPVATGAELTALARAGSSPALAAFAELGRWVGLGLVNLTAIFAPDVIVLGGGLGAEHELFAPAMAAAMANTMIPTAGVRVRAAAHGDDAGLLGAAYAALHM